MKKNKGVCSTRFLSSLVAIVVLKQGDYEHEFTIVGSTEADSMAHKISNESPVGEAILGKKKGDTVTVKAPGGIFEYKILKIK